MEVDSLDGDFSAPSPEEKATAPAVYRGYSWRATLDLLPEMVIARPVVGTTGSRATLHLAIGSVITTDMLAQLMNKGVECVAVLNDVPKDPAAYADAVSRYEHRLREIFEPAPGENCLPLFEALIKHGPFEC